MLEGLTKMLVFTITMPTCHVGSTIYVATKARDCRSKVTASEINGPAPGYAIRFSV